VSDMTTTTTFGYAASCDSTGRSSHLLSFSSSRSSLTDAISRSSTSLDGSAEWRSVSCRFFILAQLFHASALTQADKPAVIRPNTLIVRIDVHCLTNQVKFAVPFLSRLRLIEGFCSPDWNEQMGAMMPCTEIGEIGLNLGQCVGDLRFCQLQLMELERRRYARVSKGGRKGRQTTAC
jgi:hypothetical protein